METSIWDIAVAVVYIAAIVFMCVLAIFAVFGGRWERRHDDWGER